MKKLMIAALAAAAVGGAYAGCEKGEDKNCAEVYDVSMTIKTTQCKCAAKTTVTKNACGKEKNTSCVAWREVTTKKVTGAIWSCTCSCDDDLDTDSILQVTPEWWDYETSAFDAKGNQYFWFKSGDELDAANLMTFKYLGRIGKKNDKVEAAGTFGDGIYFAGFGSYDTKNSRVKNISGNLAGIWGAPYDCSSDDLDNPEDCPVYQLCDGDTVLDDISWTAASGSFSVKYNSSKSKKLMANKLPVTEKDDAIASYESKAM